MDQTITPLTVTLTPDVSAYLTESGTSDWQDSTTYRVYYNVSGTGTQSGVDVDVDIARDLSGNLQTEVSDNNVFNINL